MIGYQVRRMIRELRDQGMTISAIARKLELDRKTVRTALKQPQSGKYQRNPRPTILDHYEDHIRQRLQDYDLSAVRLLGEIRKQGYTGGYTTVKAFVAEVKDSQVQHAVVRFETQPGGQGQVDWAHFGKVLLDGEERKLYCFVLTLGYSRMRYVEFTLDMTTPTLIQCHQNAFQYLGGYPRQLLYDWQSQVAHSKDDKLVWNPMFEDFAKHYGFLPKLCKPYRAQTKGKVENSVKFVRGNFFEGRVFASLQDINAQALQWCDEVSHRPNGTTHVPPRQRWAEEHLQPIADKPAYVVTQSFARKVNRECFVSLFGNKYSVPWKHAARPAVVKMRQGKVLVEISGQVVAEHELCASGGHVVRVAEHFTGLRATRQRTPQTQRVQDWSGPAPEVERRSLSEYDRML
jgi:transposase